MVGLGTAVALTARGVDVRVVEAVTPMGGRSLGGSRIFRLAHAEPDLVAAADRCRALWDRWSWRAGRPLVGDEGCVVSGPRVPAWVAAMDAAGVAHEVADAPASLPGPVDGPVLHDPAGGVIDVRATGALLLAGVDVVPGAVREIDGTRVVTDSCVLDADAVAVCAGAGTAPLVAPLGVDVPSVLEQHVRLSFPLRGPSRPPCHLDGSGDGAGGALASTYSHRTHEGWWAIGGHLRSGADPDDQRAAVTALAARYPDLDPTPVDEVACTPTAGLGDGVHTARAGAVHVVWGENLFKLAPLVSDLLADAVVTDGQSPAIGSGAEVR